MTLFHLQRMIFARECFNTSSFNILYIIFISLVISAASVLSSTALFFVSFMSPMEQQVDRSSQVDLTPSTSAEYDLELENLIPIFVDQIGEDTVKSLIATKEIKHGGYDKGLVTFSRRFLRAEKKNLEKAVARAKMHAKWRSEALPRGYIIEVGMKATKAVCFWT